MIRNVFLDFQDGNGFRDISSLVKYDTLNVTLRAFSENFHYAQNEASFDVIYDATIFPLLRYAIKDIIVKIVNVHDVTTFLALESSGRLKTEDGFYLLTETGGFDPFFYGRISPNKSRTYNGVLSSTMMTLQAEDDTMLLDKAVGDIVYSGYTIMNPSSPSTSIVHQLAYLAGLSSSQINSNTAISNYFSKFAPNNPEDSILDVLSALLFEYGYTLNFGTDGILTPLRWINTDTVGYNFTESNMLRQVQINDTARTYFGAEVTYYEIGTITDALLYRDSNCPYADTGGFTGYYVSAGTSYPPITNVVDPVTGLSTVVYQEYTDDSIRYFTNPAIVKKLDYNYKAFSSDFSGILATANHWVDKFVDPGMTVDSPVFFNRKAQVKYSNPTASGLNLYFNNIYGDVWYKSTERKSAVINTTISGSKIDHYVSNFLYSKADADRFVQYLAAIYDVGSIVYTVIFDTTTTNEVPREAGEIVNITMNDGTNQNCIIAERSWDETSCLYTYKLRAYGTDTGTLSYGSVSSIPTTLDLRTIVTSELIPANVSVSALIDGSSPVLTSAFTRMKVSKGGADVSPYWTYAASVTGVTGGFGTGVDINKYTITGFTSNATVAGTVTITASRDGYDNQVRTFYISKIFQDDAVSVVDLSDLQAQVDLKIETWFQTTDPQTAAPAPWAGVGTNITHTGDIWYNTTSGNKTSHRWNGSAWADILDQDALDALEDAAVAQSTADGKLDIFSFRPTSGSYALGDLWYNTTDRKMYVCTTARNGSGWSSGDWSIVVPTLSDDMIPTVKTYTPRYYGKYKDEEPSGTHVEGDVYTRYSETSGTANRGVFVYTNGNWVRNATDAKYIKQAMADIAFIISYKVNGVYTYGGSATDYTSDSTIQADYAFFQQAFVGFLEAANVHIVASGSIYGGDRYNASGTPIDSTKSGFHIGANGVCKVAGIEFEGSQGGGVQWGAPCQIGSDFSLSDISDPAITALNGSTVAFIDSGVSGTRDLCTYSWSGITWTAIGTALHIPSLIGKLAITTLSSSRIALAYTTLSGTMNCRLATYDWNGSVWALVGSVFSTIVDTSYTPAITALSSNTVALNDTTSRNLSTYSFDGSSWAKIGNSMYISGIYAYIAITTLNATTIARIDDTNEKLAVYSWNGSDWSIVGTELTISDISVPAIVSLNGTDIALVDHATKSLRMYRWDGVNWTYTSDAGMTQISSGIPALTALNGMDIVYANSFMNILRVYRFPGCISRPYSRNLTG